MATLHIFNPEHDYALAEGRKRYTPSRGVAAMRKERAVLPALMAAPGDAILLLDHHSPEEKAALMKRAEIAGKGLTLLNVEELSARNDIKGMTPAPWGWDHTIRAILLQGGIDEARLPSPEYIDRLRELSHRNTTAVFCCLLNTLIIERFSAGSAESLLQPVPQELFSAEEIADFVGRNPGCFLKAPWSSSGRGVIDTATLSLHKIEEWGRGIIRRQGSVMGEVRFAKTTDFATEWICISGKAEFAGYSLFNTTHDGRYQGNICAPQNELLSELKRRVPGFGEDIVEIQREVLDTIVAPFYDGPLGIDMMGDGAGHMRLCVELNLRMTMGHVALIKAKTIDR